MDQLCEPWSPPGFHPRNGHHGKSPDSLPYQYRRPWRWVSQLQKSPALLPSNPRKSPHLASMTAFHAAPQRSRAVFSGRQADFAKVASCAVLTSAAGPTKASPPSYAKVGNENGPEATSTNSSRAALQLSHCGRSCILQHFHRSKFGSADKAPFRCGCANGCFRGTDPDRNGRL